MDVKLLEEKNGKMSFIVKNTDHVYMNTLRRMILTEVPTLAIHECEYKKNNSALYDEMIAHRLGLVPLKTDLKTYSYYKECKCKEKGCQNCSVAFTLKVKGPKTVYASDIKFKDEKVEVIYPEMIVAELSENQEINVSGIAVLGKGKEHTKFSPGHAYYRIVPKINVSTCPNAQEVEEMCPKDVFESSGKTGLKVKEELNCDMCMQCVDLCDKIEIKPTNDFIFYVESWGQLKPKEIVEEAFKLLDEKLDNFEKQIKKIK